MDPDTILVWVIVVVNAVAAIVMTMRWMRVRGTDPEEFPNASGYIPPPPPATSGAEGGGESRSDAPGTEVPREEAAEEARIMAAFDPLDAANQLPSPFTGERVKCGDYEQRARRWEGLPIYKDKAKLMAIDRSIRNNNVTMIVSGTGSGKTVVVPKLAHRVVRERLPKLTTAERVGYWAIGMRQPGSTVAVTNPKTLTTVANAEYSAFLSCVNLGDEIGYNHRDAPTTSASPRTQLEYVTDGYLLTLSKSDPDFSDYGVVIIDEAHERPVPTDFLLLALKRAMSRRPELRVVIMSATMDTAPFLRYFGESGLRVGDLAVSGVPNYPIERIFAPLVRGETYVSKAIAIILDIVRDPNAKPGGILVFVPVTNDTGVGCKRLVEECAKQGLNCARESGTPPALRCMRLYSGVDDAECDRATAGSASVATRNVIFSTNVAESSLTVRDLGYVIDSGQAFRVRFDAAREVTTAGRQTITKAEATQRIGRVGRERPGTAYLLYPKFVFERMESEPPPSIAGVDVSEQMFEMLASTGEAWPKVREGAKQLITPATDAQLRVAENTLSLYGIIDDRGELSATGEAMYELYRGAKTSLANCLFLFAGRMTGAEPSVARTIVALEAGVLPRLAAKIQPEACESSAHVAALKTYEKALWKLGEADLADLEENATRMQDAAATFYMPLTSALSWPWRWLARQQTLWKSVKCTFFDNSRCARSPAIDLADCDEFHRALLVSKLHLAVVNGVRVFGTRAAVTTKPSADTSTVYVGDSLTQPSFTPSRGGTPQPTLNVVSAFTASQLTRELLASAPDGR